jgi:hypothetical protein
MKGVVFTEFLEFVEKEYGYQVVDHALDNLVLPSGGAYTAVGTYDPQEMAMILSEVSKKTQVATETLLRLYGHFLWQYFVKHFPNFFKKDNPYDFLCSIEEIIHPEVKKLYHDAELPSFDTEVNDAEKLVMVYKSPRKMFALAKGLMEACLLHYQVDSKIEEEILNDGREVRFTIHK